MTLLARSMKGNALRFPNVKAHLLDLSSNKTEAYGVCNKHEREPLVLPQHLDPHSGPRLQQDGGLRRLQQDMQTLALRHGAA